MPTPADAFARLLETLDRLEIPYSVGGSAASSTHGLPRMTNDIDLVVDMKPDQIDEFAELLGEEFYADAQLIRDCFARGRAANLIHYATAFKFDLFPRKNDEYSGVEFGRRTFGEVVCLGGEPIECMISSAEDTILRKLAWYRAGGGTSERQWNDVRGIRRTQGSRLDIAYLRTWAPRLNVGDLVERLLNEAPA